jgi:hypothetical protein
MDIETQPPQLELSSQKKNTKLQQRSEICKRRGVCLPPIITTSVPLDFTIQKNSVMTPNQRSQEEGDSTSLEIITPEASKESDESLTLMKTPTPPPDELYEEKLSRYKAFFADVPLLMRCLDTEDDKRFIPDLLFNTLLKDVHISRVEEEYRGVAQIRSFWDDVRKQLRFDDSELGNYWPNGYPVHPAHHPEGADGSDEDVEIKVYRYSMVMPHNPCVVQA